MTTREPPTHAGDDAALHRETVEELHRRRVERLSAPGGWLALVAKGFLHEGDNALGADPSSAVVFPGDAPARVGTAALSLARREVRFTPAPGVEVTLDGAALPPGAPVVMKSDAHGSAQTFAVGRFSFQLMERGDAFAIRVRDPDSEARRAFGGIDRFAVDPRWRIDARFVAHTAPREVDIDFEGDAIAHAFVSPGFVELALPGDATGALYRLEVLYEDDTRRRLFVLFGDATNGRDTYGIGRFLYAPLPDASSRTVLDFNTAMLPACAFTPWATCPLPPRANKLPVRVEAGEKQVRS